MRLSWLVAVAIATLTPGENGPASAPDLPHFEGAALVQPTGYEEWPVAGTSLGLSYSESSTAGPGSFHRVYMNPSAYRAFKRTGTFPDGTTFVLELFEARERTSILKGGFFEGRRTGLEASVKDRARFASGWAYFGFENGARARALAHGETECHACHAAHGQVDSVFVQFYPKLRAD
jgi:hypothetical protein